MRSRGIRSEGIRSEGIRSEGVRSQGIWGRNARAIALGVIAVVGLAASALRADPQVEGTLVEVRLGSSLARQRAFESRTTDDLRGLAPERAERAILAWAISKGEWNGVRLDGQTVVLVVDSDGPLVQDSSIEAQSPRREPDVRSSVRRVVAIVGRNVSSRERRALLDLTESFAPDWAKRIDRVESREIRVRVPQHGADPHEADTHEPGQRGDDEPESADHEDDEHEDDEHEDDEHDDGDHEDESSESSTAGAASTATETPAKRLANCEILVGDGSAGTGSTGGTLRIRSTTIEHLHARSVGHEYCRGACAGDSSVPSLMGEGRRLERALPVDVRVGTVSASAVESPSRSGSRPARSGRAPLLQPDDCRIAIGSFQL